MAPLGKYIVRARERRGWTRAELARRADVPYTTLRNIEKAEHDVRPGEQVLRSLAGALAENETDTTDMFVQMRILAGYFVVASKDATERDLRLIANLSAHNNLRTALEDLFARGDPDEIDRAFTALEVTERLKGRR